MGEVPVGHGDPAHRARAGDDVWVSGTLGDAMLALAVLQGARRLTGAESRAGAARLERPSRASTLGQALRGVASAMLDVSDGLDRRPRAHPRASGRRRESSMLARIPRSAGARREARAAASARSRCAACWPAATTTSCASRRRRAHARARRSAGNRRGRRCSRASARSRRARPASSSRRARRADADAAARPSITSHDAACTARAAPTLRFLLPHPAHFIALGFGAGLAPFAPGTFGTLRRDPDRATLLLVVHERRRVPRGGRRAAVRLGAWAAQRDRARARRARPRQHRHRRGRGVPARAVLHRAHARADRVRVRCCSGFSTSSSRRRSGSSTRA